MTLRQASWEGSVGLFEGLLEAVTKLKQELVQAPESIPGTPRGFRPIQKQLGPSSVVPAIPHVPSRNCLTCVRLNLDPRPETVRFHVSRQSQKYPQHKERHPLGFRSISFGIEFISKWGDVLFSFVSKRMVMSHVGVSSTDPHPRVGRLFGGDFQEHPMS